MEATLTPEAELQDVAKPLIEQAVKDFEPKIRKAADDLYADLLYSVQDYLLDNVLGNTKGAIDAANRQALHDRQALRGEQDKSAALQIALRCHARWLSERAEWLRKEYLNGGDFEHLNTREKECRYALEKLSAAIAATVQP